MSRTVVGDAPLMRVVGVSKTFGGTKALQNVSMAFHGGEVHALLGENGAGKSTLMKIIAGVHSADEGELIGSRAGELDVAMVFQELSVVPEMSVRENMEMSRFDNRRLFVNHKALEPGLRSALDAAGLGDLDLDMPVEALPLAQRQLLEIARGLYADAKVLILDEPTATLSDVEIERVHSVVRSLVRQGHGIVYITHRLGEVFTLADRITIMRSGEVVASGLTSRFTMDEVVTMMLGHEHTAEAAEPVEGLPPELERRQVTVTGLAAAHQFSDVSFSVRAGEVLTVFGQIGSGADQVIRALAGLAHVSSGSVHIDLDRVHLNSRPASQADGVAYVSADRTVEGVFLDYPVSGNISSGALERISTRGLLSARRERTLAKQYSTLVAFDAKRINTPVGALSGGNQQKIAIARALATSPKVLVLNEPTRGVDIGARAEIYKVIRSLAHQNVAVIVYSSDIVELRELGDRVITMFRGGIVGDRPTRSVDDAQLLSEILHGVAA
ncbi:sugar ABC transporter ATP-binding protein [Aldersonia sp. NBC_00410]|uniref:sugar ABC transporter ATP-binding protein n=1 Tax=Aldersonia sp. NBC_00410 TaxID=2975954 RepID=UPI002259524E|nr:sugar ABC transporter ATP-binding protein [Aldersonia sp. NBC_00410]MCX5043465.1 sugar ABC transporter ATP-binding protein [Aldersonia sp. NBC_00410]